MRFPGSLRIVKRAILVDGDNLPHFSKQLKKRDLVNSEVHVFYGMQNRHIPKIAPCHIKMHVSPSSGKDSADISLCMFAQQIIMKESHEEIVVCSLDKFSITLVEIINASYKIKARRVTDPCSL